MIKFGIGQAVRRVEDQRFLTGQGRYVDDITLPGICHGVNVLSPHAHARIHRSYAAFSNLRNREGEAGRDDARYTTAHPTKALAPAKKNIVVSCASLFT